MSESEVVSNWCLVSSTGTEDWDVESKNTDPSQSSEKDEITAGNSELPDGDTKSDTSSDVDIIDESFDTFTTSYSPSCPEFAICPPDIHLEQYLPPPIVPTSSSKHVACQTRVTMKDGWCCWLIFEPAIQWLLRKIAEMILMCVVVCLAFLVSRWGLYFISVNNDGKSDFYVYRDLLHTTLECLGKQHIEALNKDDVDLLHSRICRDKSGKYGPIFQSLIKGSKLDFEFLSIYNLPGYTDDVTLLHENLELIKLQLKYFGLLPERIIVQDLNSKNEKLETYTKTHFQENEFISGMRIKLSNYSTILNSERKDEISSSHSVDHINSKMMLLLEMTDLMTTFHANLSAATNYTAPQLIYSSNTVYLKAIQQSIENLTITNQKLHQEIHNHITSKETISFNPSKTNGQLNFEHHDDGNEELKEGIISLFLENENLKRKLQSLKTQPMESPKSSYVNNQDKKIDDSLCYDRIDIAGDGIISDSLITILNLTKQIAFMQNFFNSNLGELKHFSENISKIFNWKDFQKIENDKLWNILESKVLGIVSNIHRNTTEPEKHTQNTWNWEKLKDNAINVLLDLQSRLNEKFLNLSNKHNNTQYSQMWDWEKIKGKISGLDDGTVAEVVHSCAQSTKRNAEHILNKVSEYFVAAQDKTAEIFTESMSETSNNSLVKKVMWYILDDFKGTWSRLTGTMKNITVLFNEKKSATVEHAAEKESKGPDTYKEEHDSNWLLQRAANRATVRKAPKSNWFLERELIRAQLRRRNQRL